MHRDVRTIGTETCHFLGLEITKPAVEIVAELVYKKLAVYGADLEAFAKLVKLFKFSLSWYLQYLRSYDSNLIAAWIKRLVTAL